MGGEIYGKSYIFILAALEYVTSASRRSLCKLLAVNETTATALRSKETLARVSSLPGSVEILVAFSMETLC
jgi:hypothetical protein